MFYLFLTCIGPSSLSFATWDGSVSVSVRIRVVRMSVYGVYAGFLCCTIPCERFYLYRSGM